MKPLPGAILGIDGGFANTGVVSAVVNPVGHITFLNAWVIKTKKDSEAKSVAMDNLRRAREIYVELERILRTTRASTVCLEAMSHPRNASTAGKLALFWGVFAGLVDPSEREVRMGQPLQLRRKVLGEKDAPEVVVHEHMMKNYEGLEPLALAFGKTDRKHILDAAIAVAALHTRTRKK